MQPWKSAIRGTRNWLTMNISNKSEKWRFLDPIGKAYLLHSLDVLSHRTPPSTAMCLGRSLGEAKKEGDRMGYCFLGTMHGYGGTFFEWWTVLPVVLVREIHAAENDEFDCMGSWVLMFPIIHDGRPLKKEFFGCRYYGFVFWWMTFWSVWNDFESKSESLQVHSKRWNIWSGPVLKPADGGNCFFPLSSEHLLRQIINLVLTATKSPKRRDLRPHRRVKTENF